MAACAGSGRSQHGDRLRSHELLKVTLIVKEPPPATQSKRTARCTGGLNCGGQGRMASLGRGGDNRGFRGFVKGAAGFPAAFGLAPLTRS